MSYFIFDQTESINLFAKARAIEKVDGQTRVCGEGFRETKNFLPSTMAMIIQRDICQTISDDGLPEMEFEVKVASSTPTPLYRIEIRNLAEPIVLRMAQESEPDIKCETSSVGRVYLTELAHYIRAKIMQLLWKYNADLITEKGLYGHTHFNFQIVLSQDLIERQVNSFDIGRDRIEKEQTRRRQLSEAA